MCSGARLGKGQTVTQGLEKQGTFSTVRGSSCCRLMSGIGDAPVALAIEWTFT